MTRPYLSCHGGTQFVLAAAMASMAMVEPAAAQPNGQNPTLPSVTISAQALRDPVEKSYRRMVRAMDLFERERPAVAPDATLRFKLLPRKVATRLDGIELNVLGTTVETPVPIAPDHTFTLERDPRALQENAQVTPNRRALTLTWRAEVRTPGLPPGTRRLGDLRLECRVGMEAGLVSNHPSFITRLVGALSDTPDYCHRPDNRYLFFAERPVFGVTLVSGTRRETLPVERLWASAIGRPELRGELPFCDCEVLLDRAYFLPLGDARWPHDTLVVFDFMEAAHAAD